MLVFFGWYKLLQNESLLEFPSAKTRSNKIKKFVRQFVTTLAALTEPVYLFQLNNISRSEYDSARVPVLALAAIGELMIKNQKDKDSLTQPGLIDIVEFASKLRSDADFKAWFPYLESFLSGLKQSYAKRNRIILFDIYVVSLIGFLERFDSHSSSIGGVGFLKRLFSIKDKNNLEIRLDSLYKDLDDTLFETMKEELESLGFRLIRFSNSRPLL